MTKEQIMEHIRGMLDDPRCLIAYDGRQTVIGDSSSPWISFSGKPHTITFKVSDERLSVIAYVHEQRHN